MAVSKKGKRRITVNGKKFLYWFFNETDQTAFDGNQIKIIAEDQSVYFKYGLEQEDESRYLVFALDQDFYRVHIFCPKFEDENGIIKPAGIHQLLHWSSLYPSTKHIRDLQHAYNSTKGIQKGKDRQAALIKILEVLHGKVNP